ncbi:MAG: hypothetical protein EBS42_05265 [Caulobacteraceae bacterium]|nr:hypothetical protein [Caulobacteraceae bacterium]
MGIAFQEIRQFHDVAVGIVIGPQGRCVGHLVLPGARPILRLVWRAVWFAVCNSIERRLPEVICRAPQDCRADAVLVIGDRAMNPERYRSDFFLDWDLGEQWFALTGLPFIFAMWVARSPAFDDPKIIRLLESSRDAGLENIDEIIATLQYRRERFGFNYIVVHEAEMAAFAPVVAALTGR